jgi:hypothetical protein
VEVAALAVDAELIGVAHDVAVAAVERVRVGVRAGAVAVLEVTAPPSSRSITIGTISPGGRHWALRLSSCAIVQPST